MVPVEGSEWTVEVDVVLIAAGFLGSQKYVTDAFKVDPDTAYERGNGSREISDFRKECLYGR